mmetsp:Transcript_49408/g.107860  ORF Transcript_49408/g.107860 Transcript_49408/m.107860 type:complete len:229 (+) Transcript_49408:258-944(+)
MIPPQCWNVSLVDVMIPDGSQAHVFVKDVAPKHTLNNGVVILRNSHRGRFFLDLLLEKISWVHTFEHDQGAFDETMLELLGTEVAGMRAEGNDVPGTAYDSWCAPNLFPSASGHHNVALYSLCWWGESQRLAGEFGQRTSKVVHFVNPRVADINHVVGFQGLSQPALLYHFAGRGKSWEAILEAFGATEDMLRDCFQVWDYVDSVASNTTCIMGNSGVQECPPPLAVC